MKKILVLGSNSPSGAHFCRHAATVGHEVIATSRSPELDSVFLPYRWKDVGVRFEQVDINRDIAKLETILKAEKPAAVVNFASQSMVGESWQRPADWMTTNVVGLVNLLELLRKQDSLDLYLHFSTPEVYGSTDGWVEENERYAPSSPYASSRAAGDMNVTLWAKTYGLPTIITRAANVYGEAQQLYRIIPRTLYCCYGGQKLALQGGGLSERAFIHFDDVSEALLLLLAKGKRSECYHLSPHSAVSIKRLVERICEIAGHAYGDVVQLGPDRLGKDFAYLLSSKKIETELGWTPRISLDEGLARCADWYRENMPRFATAAKAYVHKP